MTMTELSPKAIDRLMLRIGDRREEITEAKERLARLFESQHLDYLRLFQAGVPKLQIANAGGTDKQQVRKAIDNMLAKHPELVEGD
jgi:predicted acetyltransferase